MQKNKGGPLPYTIYKNLQKMDHRPKCNSYRNKTIRRNTGTHVCDIGLGNNFSDITPKSLTPKEK